MKGKTIKANGHTFKESCHTGRDNSTAGTPPKASADKMNSGGSKSGHATGRPVEDGYTSAG